LQPSVTRSTSPRSRSRGFSIVELAVSLAIMLILSAVAIPTMMNALRAYQLNDAAARVSDLLKFTRFEAVRRNTQVSFWLQANGANNWIVGVDSNGNGVIDPAERQEVITGFATLLPSGGLPATTPITTALGVGTLTTLSGNNGSVTFDARGAIRTGVAPGSPLTTNVSIIYIGSTTDGVTPDPQYGFRAVVALPAGGTQVWTAPPGGIWQRIA
jgi:type IV fimbrial biogenesis protein FimT